MDRTNLVLPRGRCVFEAHFKRERRIGALHSISAIKPFTTPEILLIFLGSCANADFDLVEQRDDTSLHKFWPKSFSRVVFESSHCKRSIVSSYKWPTDLSSSRCENIRSWLA